MHHKEKQRTHLDRIILCWNILKQTIALPSSKKKWGEGMSTEQKLTVILWKIWALLRIQCDNTYFQNIVGIQIKKKKKEYFLKSLRYFQCKYRSVLLQLAHLTILNILEKILWKIFFPRQPRINFSTVILNFFRDILLVFHTIIICHSGTRLPCPWRIDSGFLSPNCHRHAVFGLITELSTLPYFFCHKCQLSWQRMKKETFRSSNKDQYKGSL